MKTHILQTKNAVLRFLLFASGCLLACVAISGCSSQGTRSCRAQGTVTIDGKPIAVGQISFDITVDGDVSSAGPIAEGKYDLWVSPGRKKVRISAVDMTSVESEAGDDGFVTTKGTAKDLVPAKYATNPLEIEITKSGVYDISLTSE